MSQKRLLIVVVSATDAAIEPPLAAAFAEDTLLTGTHPQVRADVWLVAGADTLDGELPQGVTRLAPEGDMQNAAGLFQRAFEAGYSPVCVMRTDTPHLPPALLQEAFGRMEQSQVTGAGVEAVWGPVEGGGCCLVGLRQPRNDLFAGAGLFPSAADLTARAQAAGLAYHALPTWYVVRTREDAARLRCDLLRQVVDARATAKYFVASSL